MACLFSGVVYAHRNENVVNCMSKAKDGDGVSSKDKQSSEYWKAPELHLHTEKDRSRGTSKGLEEGKECTKKRPTKIKADMNEVDKVKLMNKEDQFAYLANFKKMDKTQFSRWLLSASEADKQELLFNFKQRKKSHT